MKKIIILLLILSNIIACSPEPQQLITTLEVNVTQQPTLTNKIPPVLTTTLYGYVKGPQKPVKIHIQWLMQTVENNHITLFNEIYCVMSQITPEKLMISTMLNQNMPPAYFWAQISWTDDAGPKIIITNKIYYNITKI